MFLGRFLCVDFEKNFMIGKTFVAFAPPETCSTVPKFEAVEETINKTDKE